MIVPYRRWLNRLKYVLLFIVLTYALYHVFDYMAAWIEPNKYREPDGRALKVFEPEEGTKPGDESETVAERLKLFYWYGE